MFSETPKWCNYRIFLSSALLTIFKPFQNLWMKGKQSRQQNFLVYRERSSVQLAKNKAVLALVICVGLSLQPLHAALSPRESHLPLDSGKQISYWPSQATPKPGSFCSFPAHLWRRTNTMNVKFQLLKEIIFPFWSLARSAQPHTPHFVPSLSPSVLGIESRTFCMLGTLPLSYISSPVRLFIILRQRLTKLPEVHLQLVVLLPILLPQPPQ